MIDLHKGVESVTTMDHAEFECQRSHLRKDIAMSDWITDRRPMHEDDGPMVYGPDGNICHWTWIKNGDAWKPIPKCEPYVKPKRWEAKWNGIWWSLYYDGEWRECLTRFEKQNDQHREAAERIAAIYEEVMP